MPNPQEMDGKDRKYGTETKRARKCVRNLKDISTYGIEEENNIREFSSIHAAFATLGCSKLETQDTWHTSCVFMLMGKLKRDLTLYPSNIATGRFSTLAGRLENDMPSRKSNERSAIDGNDDTTHDR